MRARNFIKESLRLQLLNLLMSVIYALTIFHDSNVESTVIYIIIIGSYMTVATGITYHTATLPLALSFGCTRKEAVIGMQLGRLTGMLFHLAVGAALVLLFQEHSGSINWYLLPMVAGLHLLSNAASVVISMMYRKWGTMAMIVGMIIPVIPIMLLISLLPDGFLDAKNLAWVLPLLGAVLYGLALIPELRYIKRCNVKL